ncbi:MAG: Ig-like domain-containing protein [Verrucomicrobiota bacterium]|nr:Ig-like domain-containing protein [Verrucomicrobiota bacterium]
MKAEAVDADGNVEKVLFFSNGTELGLDESASYELEWIPTPQGEQLLTAVAVDNRCGETVSDAIAVRVLPPDDAIGPKLLSSATVVGEYYEETEASLDQGNKIFTVKQSGEMLFYRLLLTGEAKPKITAIRVKDGNAVVSYQIVEE